MLIYFLNVNIYYVSVVKSFSCIKVLVILSFFFCKCVLCAQSLGLM